MDLAALWLALGELPRRQRQAILLREFSGLSYGELAGALAVSEPAVESLLFRARRDLRLRLNPTGSSVTGIAPLAAIREALSRTISGMPDPGTTGALAKIAAAPLVAKLTAGAAAVVVAGGTVAAVENDSLSGPRLAKAQPDVAVSRSAPSAPAAPAVAAGLATARPAKPAPHRPGKAHLSAQAPVAGGHATSQPIAATVLTSGAPVAPVTAAASSGSGASGGELGTAGPPAPSPGPPSGGDGGGNPGAAGTAAGSGSGSGSPGDDHGSGSSGTEPADDHAGLSRLGRVRRRHVRHRGRRRGLRHVRLRRERLGRRRRHRRR